jgi:hypothetical protein
MNFRLNRDEIARAFDTHRAVRAFEKLQETVAATDEVVTAQLGPTGGVQQATYVTLSANDELPNERVLAFGSGIGYTLTDNQIIIRLSANTPTISGGFRLGLTVEGDSNVAVPLTGILATRDNIETLTGKTLAAPKLSGLGDYADDVAAAAGLVPVGGVYRTASTIKVRVS